MPDQIKTPPQGLDRLPEMDVDEFVEPLATLTRLITRSRRTDEMGAVEYKVSKGGKCFGNELLVRRDRIAVQDVFFAAGTAFPIHDHEVREWGIVYEGVLEITCGDATVALGRGELMYFEPGETHAAYALENCSVLFVTIPPDPGYPGVK